MQEESSLSERDRRNLLILAAATVVVRAVFTVLRKIDSDEPQHLHVAWAWTKGLVQYRDVFDNHLPLLHMLFAPVMPLAPESSGVFLFMRAAIAPFAIACAYLFYLLVKPFYGTRIAAVAALTFSVSHPWLPKSVEFRNDTLWMFFWLAALALFVRNRHFAAGVMMALSFLASIKTAPIVLAHALAFATQRRGGLRRPGRGPGPADRPSLRDARANEDTASRRPGLSDGSGPVGPAAGGPFVIPFILGGALPGALLTIALLALGAFDDMLYQTLFFNASAPVESWRRPAGVICFIVVGSAIFRFGRRAAHLTLFALWYISLLLAFWPILTPRDFLPVMPILVLSIILKVRTLVIAPVVIATILSVIDARLWRPRENERERFVDAVVSVAAPGDYVLDLKGDAVFRRRPVMAIYEDVGRALTATGKLADEGPERIVATGACVAIRDTSHLPPRTRDFLERHFLDDPLMRVCGTRVTGETFEIGVPQTYAVVARDPSHVRIDGIPYRAPRRLEAGPHTMDRGGNESVLVLWSPAAAKEQQ